LTTGSFTKIHSLVMKSDIYSRRFTWRPTCI